MGKKEKSLESICREVLAKAQEFYDMARAERKSFGITITIKKVPLSFINTDIDHDLWITL